MTTALGPIDQSLRDRANLVVPGGMYGHMRAGGLPEGYPQFFARGEGCHLWDVDGRKYLDFMCSWGPVVLGHRHPAVDAAARRQMEQGDCLNGPTERMVELAERMVGLVTHADWALFSKNGTDATTTCVTLARGARRLAGAFLPTRPPATNPNCVSVCGGQLPRGGGRLNFPYFLIAGGAPRCPARVRPPRCSRAAAHRSRITAAATAGRRAR